MAGASFLFRIGASFGKLLKGGGSFFGSIGKGFSTWLSSLKFGNILKIGGAGGIIAIVYNAWNSGIQTISDASGLSADTVSTLIFIGIAVLILYIVYRIIVPRTKEDLDRQRYMFESRKARRYGYQDYDYRSYDRYYRDDDYRRRY